MREPGREVGDVGGYPVWGVRNVDRAGELRIAMPAVLVMVLTGLTVVTVLTVVARVTVVAVLTRGQPYGLTEPACAQEQPVGKYYLPVVAERAKPSLAPCSLRRRGPRGPESTGGLAMERPGFRTEYEVKPQLGDGTETWPAPVRAMSQTEQLRANMAETGVHALCGLLRG